MQFDLWLDAYNQARNARPVLTMSELRAAFMEGYKPADIATNNDDLASEYDA